MPLLLAQKKIAREGGLGSKLLEKVILHLWKRKVELKMVAYEILLA